MIQLEISGVHFEIDDQIQKYIRAKVGKLDRYLPKGAREPLQGSVILTESGAATERYTCEITLAIPRGRAAARTATPNNMYAAIDLASEKIKAYILYGVAV